MKVNENTIYIFLLGILAGIICMQCVNHFRKSPKDMLTILNTRKKVWVSLKEKN